MFNPYAEETFKNEEDQIKDAIELYSRIGCKTIHDPDSTGWLPDDFTYNDYKRKAGILKTSSPLTSDEKDLFGDDVPTCQKNIVRIQELVVVSVLSLLKKGES